MMFEIAPGRLRVERPQIKSLDEMISKPGSQCRVCKSLPSLQKCPAFRRLVFYRRLGFVRKFKYCISCRRTVEVGNGVWNARVNITQC